MSIRACYMEAMEQELTRPVRAAQIKDAAQEHIIIATDAERAALALRFGLPGILQLRGEFWLRHERAGTIAATLRMRARVIQTCVITLDPFEAKISEDTELRFVPASSLPESEGIELDPETLEAPDEIPYAGECIDLGETSPSNWRWRWTLIRANLARNCRKRRPTRRRTRSRF